MADPMSDYKAYVLANLPADITVDPKTGFFIHNGHAFPTYKQCIWYKNYLNKYRKANTSLVITGGIITNYVSGGIPLTQIEFNQSTNFNLIGQIFWSNLALAGAGANGGRGSGTNYIPGGGGAGRLIERLGQPLQPGAYSLSIGAGAPSTGTYNGQTSGSPSQLIMPDATLNAPGGGRGGNASVGFSDADPGGSGGGGRAANLTGNAGLGAVSVVGTPIAGLGNNGGNGFLDPTTDQGSSGGGGGAGGVGGNGALNVPGLGGAGYLLSWLQTPLEVCRGGAGTKVADFATTPDETYGSGTKGTNIGSVGKAGDGFMFLTVRSDQVTVT